VENHVVAGSWSTAPLPCDKEVSEQNAVLIVGDDGKLIKRRCRVCGCTDDNACWDPVANHPCYWVEDDLCSACVAPHVARIPVFKCEDSLWQMLADGYKTFDARQCDLTDSRIMRLAGKPPFLTVEAVSFKNKATGEVLTFAYKGMEYASWAPGWCFLILGEQVT